MKKISNKDLLKAYIKKWRLETALNDKLNYLELHQFEEGEMVLFSEDPLKYMYIIVEGKLRIFPLSASGKEILLSHGTPLDIMGDIEYITKDTINNNVSALKKTVLIAIAKHNIPKILDNNEEMYRFMLETMAKKLKFSGKRYYKYLMSPLKNRLASYLWELSDGGRIQNVKLNYKNSADFLAVSPRHLRRVFEELEEEGYLIKKGKLITLSPSLEELID